MTTVKTMIYATRIRLLQSRRCVVGIEESGTASVDQQSTMSELATLAESTLDRKTFSLVDFQKRRILVRSYPRA